MAERWVPEVMGERSGFGRVLVEGLDEEAGPWFQPAFPGFVLKALGEPACDLGDLQRVGEATVECVPDLGCGNLSDVPEAQQRGGVKDAVPVALCLATNGRRRLEVPAFVELLAELLRWWCEPSEARWSRGSGSEPTRRGRGGPCLGGRCQLFRELRRRCPWRYDQGRACAQARHRRGP